MIMTMIEKKKLGKRVEKEEKGKKANSFLVSSREIYKIHRKKANNIINRFTTCVCVAMSECVVDVELYF
jgi:hypothetical protein